MKTVCIIILCLGCLSVRGQSDSTAYQYVKPLFDFNPHKPVFDLTPLQKENKNRFFRYFALSGYREGVPSTVGTFGVKFDGYTDKDLGVRRLYIYNLSLQDMLTHGMFPDDRVILEVKDPSHYRYLPEYGSKENWMRKNTYCFELAMPEGTTTTAMLNQMLAQSLGLHFGRQLRKVSVLVLSRTSDAEKFKSTGKGSAWYDNKGRFVNVSFEALGQALGNTGKPFLNETGYKGSVDMNLNVTDLKDLAAVGKALRGYGLEIKEETKELYMFVITEPNYIKK